MTYLKAFLYRFSPDLNNAGRKIQILFLFCCLVPLTGIV